MITTDLDGFIPPAPSIPAPCLPQQGRRDYQQSEGSGQMDCYLDDLFDPMMDQEPGVSILPETLFTTPFIVIYNRCLFYLCLPVFTCDYMCLPVFTCDYLEDQERMAMLNRRMRGGGGMYGAGTVSLSCSVSLISPFLSLLGQWVFISMLNTIPVLQVFQ